MWSMQDLVIFISTVITGVLGAIVYSSGLHVYFKHCKELSNPAVSDRIHLFTVLTDVLFHGFMITFIMFEIFQIYLLRCVFLFLIMVRAILVDTSFWNTAWLSVFYSFTLVNIHHRLLLRVRSWVTSSVPQILVATVMCSIVINTPTLLMKYIETEGNVTDELTMLYVINENSDYSIVRTVFGSYLPFLLTFVSIGLSVRTLLRHVCRMKKTQAQGTSDRLQGLIRAIVTMSLRGLLDALFYVITIVFHIPPYYLEEGWKITYCLFILIYPTAQTFIIIYGNPKLKKFFIQSQCRSQNTE